MGRKSVSIYTAHSSSVVIGTTAAPFGIPPTVFPSISLYIMEKAVDWTSGTGKERREEVEYILSSSMNTNNNQINVPVKVHWKPAVHPVEPLNEDQPAKFPMPPISLSMEEHGAQPNSKQVQSETQHKMKDAKQKKKSWISQGR